MGVMGHPMKHEAVAQPSLIDGAGFFCDAAARIVVDGHDDFDADQAQTFQAEVRERDGGFRGDVSTRGRRLDPVAQIGNWMFVDSVQAAASQKLVSGSVPNGERVAGALVPFALRTLEPLARFGDGIVGMTPGQEWVHFGYGRSGGLIQIVRICDRGARQYQAPGVEHCGGTTVAHQIDQLNSSVVYRNTRVSADQPSGDNPALRRNSRTKVEGSGS
jgi:hypothetical protein